ncbi:MAG: HD-GYP domain-containing protein [Tissierellales bacterium]|jgi:HD-GYP domain-containing protein (c-di-GMP phosphodiesterase class II)|nr:HD-GYP domain-containing protein [Tissierellales bacterium]
MREIKISEIKKGMILGAPVLDVGKTVVLLNEGTELTEKHIRLLENLKIEKIKILRDPTVPPKNEVEQGLEDELLVEKAKALKRGENFDEDEKKEHLRVKYEMEKDKVIEGVLTANKDLQVLTGEGNIPFDVKNQVYVEETKEVFSKIKSGDKIELEHIKDHIEDSYEDLVRNNDVLMRLNQLKEVDDYTYQHSLRVSMLAAMIGKWLGYTEEQNKELALAGLMFDIGKLKVPDFIMNRQFKITSNEYTLIKKHPQFGYQILLKTQGISSNVKFCALQHHERLDGSGYPLRVKSNQIHEFAKIVMVCDIYDAMISDRPYRHRYSPFDAAEYIYWNSGITLDPKVCYIFLTNLAEYYMGKKVLLNTGKKGKIIFVDMEFPTRPVIQTDDDKIIKLVENKHIRIIDMA